MDFFRLLSDNDILRRYIVMNAFDGTLTSLGILIAMRRKMSLSGFGIYLGRFGRYNS